MRGFYWWGEWTVNAVQREKRNKAKKGKKKESKKAKIMEHRQPQPLGYSVLC